MTNKEIAKQLREIAEYGDGPYTKLSELADALDPPKPEPGTVVWWRPTGTDEWRLGVIVDYGIVPTDRINVCWNWDDRINVCWNWDVNELEYKPARILAPDEVAVKVKPVQEWPKRDGKPVAEASLRWHYEDNDDWMTDYAGVVITRAEAERMEDER